MDPSFLIPSDETPEQAALRKRQAVVSALAGPQQVPQNVGQGLASLGQALMMRQQRQSAAFPSAPGGASPSLSTGFMNMFTGGQNGGFY